MLKDNWLAYLIMGVVMLHLLLGFVWLIYKMNKKETTKANPIKKANEDQLDDNKS